MIDELNLEEQIKLFQPLPYGHEYDDMNMPIIKRTLIEDLELDYIKPTNFSNLSAKYNNEDSLVLMFQKDKRLEKLWNHPLKYVPLLGSARAVLTPDYSIYPAMNYDAVRNNVYRNRYLGCLWQIYRIRVIPTIQWSLPCWDDICFSGVEKKSVVAVSTIGCQEHSQDFLRGYKEMMQRLSPALVIVYGTIIPGIYGNIFHIDYTNAFNKNKLTWEQLQLFQVSPITIIKEGEING